MRVLLRAYRCELGWYVVVRFTINGVDIHSSVWRSGKSLLFVTDLGFCSGVCFWLGIDPCICSLVSLDHERVFAHFTAHVIRWLFRECGLITYELVLLFAHAHSLHTLCPVPPAVHLSPRYILCLVFCWLWVGEKVMSCTMKFFFCLCLTLLKQGRFPFVHMVEPPFTCRLRLYAGGVNKKWMCGCEMM